MIQPVNFNPPQQFVSLATVTTLCFESVGNDIVNDSVAYTGDLYYYVADQELLEVLSRKKVQFTI